MFFGTGYMLVALVTAGISGLAAMGVKAAFARYTQVPNRRGLTGADAAREMLSREGLAGIGIERVAGTLSDHFDPGANVIRLSPDVHDGRSLAAVSVACHEAGHALQHATGYGPMKLRAFTVPLANIGGRFGPTLVIVGLALGTSIQLADGTVGPGPGLWLAKLGVLLFAGAVFFQFVTLPVELDASRRAKRAMTADGIVVDAEEAAGAASMLRAAAFTYVAAVASSILMLLYFMMRAGLLGGRRER